MATRTGPSLIFRVLDSLQVTKTDPRLSPSKGSGAVRIYAFVKECPGRRHDWVMSSAGIIRKPKGYLLRR